MIKHHPKTGEDEEANYAKGVHSAYETKMSTASKKTTCSRRSPTISRPRMASARLVPVSRRQKPPSC